ncbi:uncharacterized protein LOC134531676 isoform X3 [Bacillus rossius redtenbacheri]|uniref:uncharacterized protein LOC134531676 isoform X3 n=1 Tax=Bacillus rossius redtenbacheri TaxID=93214 RepID=UPI002FDC7FD9
MGITSLSQGNKKDPIYIVRDCGSNMDSISSWSPEKIDKDSYWPNDVIYMSSSVLGREGITWTSGFLEPGKTEGQLSVYFTDVYPLDGPYNIASLDEINWSYHRVAWLDVNNDGHADAVTVRFESGLSITSIFSRKKNLLWLENPGNGSLTAWEQHVVQTDSGDVHFEVTSLTAAGTTYQVVFMAQFFNQKLSFLYGEDGANFWTDTSKAVSVVLDDSIGKPWDLELADINQDGKVEILVSAYKNSVGSVYAYEIPDNFIMGTFTRHTLATGFEVKWSLLNTNPLTPGMMQIMYNTTADETAGKKPNIVVDGDDAGAYYILFPNSDDWSYNLVTVWNTDGTTTGTAAVADLDGDGRYELVASGYSAGKVAVFTC